MNWPAIYRYEGRWWHGGLTRWPSDSPRKLLREFFWLCRHGEFAACWQWPVREHLIFGMGREWYDGPIWFVHAGFFSIDLGMADAR